ncbi:MAG: WYL domain-containing protein [Myxococcota bacterium]
MDTTVRVLTLLGLLTRRRTWTGPELAAELGVTDRCLRRDVQRLRDLGHPVQGSGGVGGGYRLGVGSELPPLPLDDDEAVAVATGLTAVATGVVGGAEEAALRALVKLDAVLPKRLRRRLTALHEVSLQLPWRPPVVDAVLLATVARACQESRQLTFAYVTREGVASRRRVEPYHLVHDVTRWYLVAWDRDRDAWRTFRADRASDPEVGEPYRPRPLPAEDLAAWVQTKLTRDAWPHRAVARISGPEAEVRERVGSWAEVEGLEDGTCRVSMGSDRLEMIATWLATLGFDFTIESPEALKDIAATLSRRMADAAR